MGADAGINRWVETQGSTGGWRRRDQQVGADVGINRWVET